MRAFLAAPAAGSTALASVACDDSENNAQVPKEVRSLVSTLSPA
jgi:hypothetical protein